MITSPDSERERIAEGVLKRETMGQAKKNYQEVPKGRSGRDREK